jgi:ketosteroid isomerase-like protein
MTLDHATAEAILERFATAWQTFDGDAWVALFSDDVEFRVDPFDAPLVGHNAVRAYLLRAAELQEQVDFTAERHWVVDPTILVAWHASCVARENRATVRLAGFMTLEMRDGRIARLRQWVHRAMAPRDRGGRQD